MTLIFFFVKDGGAFVFGATNTYPGKSLVLHSQEIQKPIIYVTSNYRLNVSVIKILRFCFKTTFLSLFLDILQLTSLPYLSLSLSWAFQAFGFLAGKEIAEAGVANLGLKDQIFALQWVQVNLTSFFFNHRSLKIFQNFIPYHLLYIYLSN